MPHALTHTESDKTGQLLTCLQNSCWTNMQLCASADNLQTRGCVFSFSGGKKHTQRRKIQLFPEFDFCYSTVSANSVTCHLSPLALRLAEWTREAVFLTQIALTVMVLLQRESCCCIPQVSWLGRLPGLLAQPVFLSLPLSPFLAFSFKWRHMTLSFTAK